MEDDVPSGYFVEVGPGVCLIVSLGAIVGFGLSLGVWEKIHAYRIPQAEIDALARDAIARHGDGTLDDLIAYANRARMRGETGEETVYLRVARTVETMQAARGARRYRIGLRRRTVPPPPTVS
jgi:hypothetical protein